MHSYIISTINKKDDLPFPKHPEHYPAYDPEQNLYIFHYSETLNNEDIGRIYQMSS